MVTRKQGDDRALEESREAERQASVEGAAETVEYVYQANAAGMLEGRSRLAGVPLVPGGRLWLAVKLLYDHPRTFEGLRAGRFESVSAAARAAGLSAAMPRRRLTLTQDPKLWARALFAAVSESELEEAARELQRLQTERERNRKLATEGRIRSELRRRTRR